MSQTPINYCTFPDYLELSFVFKGYEISGGLAWAFRDSSSCSLLLSYGLLEVSRLESTSSGYSKSSWPAINEESSALDKYPPCRKKTQAFSENSFFYPPISSKSRYSRQACCRQMTSWSKIAWCAGVGTSWPSSWPSSVGSLVFQASPGWESQALFFDACSNLWWRTGSLVMFLREWLTVLSSLRELIGNYFLGRHCYCKSSWAAWSCRGAILGHSWGSSSSYSRQFWNRGAAAISLSGLCLGRSPQFCMDLWILHSYFCKVCLGAG